MLVKRSKALMFVLFYIFGWLYGLVWMAKVQNETNKELVCLEKDKKGVDKLSGGRIVLFSILSLGIFAIFWQFYFCKKIVRLGGKARYVIVAVLSVLFIGIIFNPLIMQGELNDIINSNYTTISTRINSNIKGKDFLS